MYTENQQRFMQMAVDLAQHELDSNFDGPFSAIIVKQNIIVGSSGNSAFKVHDPGIHAEVLAIRDACHNLKTLDLTGCQMYSSAEPCPMCMAVIYWSQISEIYFCNSGFDSLNSTLIRHPLWGKTDKQKHHCLINSVQIPTSKAAKVLERDKMKQNQQNIFIPQV